MNKTHLEHTIGALIIQLVLWFPIGLVASTGVAIAIFVGREIAQHEYRIGINRGWIYGQNLPVKWYEGVTKGWTLDSVLDIVFPAVVTIALLVVIYLLQPTLITPLPL